MGSQKIVLKIGIFWAVASLLIGCTTAQGPTNPIYESNQYPTEIARLEVAILQNPESSKGQQPHYKQENLALKEAISELAMTNVELSTKIEILKTLDHSVEEKRKKLQQ